jgi:hypothetical protein
VSTARFEPKLALASVRERRSGESPVYATPETAIATFRRTLEGVDFLGFLAVYKGKQTTYFRDLFASSRSLPLALDKPAITRVSPDKVTAAFNFYQLTLLPKISSKPVQNRPQKATLTLIKVGQSWVIDEIELR